MPRSTRTFLLICEASISRWIFFEPGEKASIRPVHAVVEARAQADHQVAIMHGVVGFVGAVHAQHAQPLRRRRRKRAQAHQGRGDGKAGQRRQFAQQPGWLPARN